MKALINSLRRGAGQMFEKVDMSVVTRLDGLYQIRQVFRLRNDFYVRVGKDTYAKLRPSGGTSYKSMMWEELEIEELHLITQGNKLVLT